MIRHISHRALVYLAQGTPNGPHLTTSCGKSLERDWPYRHVVPKVYPTDAPQPCTMPYDLRFNGLTKELYPTCPECCVALDEVLGNNDCKTEPVPVFDRFQNWR